MTNEDVRPHESDDPGKGATAQPAEDTAERDRERRAKDTETGGRRPDPRTEEGPQQPFSGADH